MKIERWEAFTVGAILTIALILRLYRLDAPLWYDEIYTLSHFVREPWFRLLGDFSSLNNHMAYSIEAKLSVGAFGETAVAMRLPALLFSLGSLLLLWWIARQPAGRAAALVAVGLAAISYHHIWFSQNARGYTQLLFFTTLATLLFLDALARPSWKLWTFYGLALAAAMYTHLSAGFFIASHGVVALWLLVRRKAGPKMIYGFATGAVVTVLLYSPVIPQILPAMRQVSGGKSSSTMAEWTNPLRTMREVIASFGELGPFVPLLVAAGSLAIVLGVVTLWRKSPILAAIYALSIPITLLLLKLLSFRIWPRYFFVDINMIILFAVLGCREIAEIAAKLARAPIARPLYAASLAAMAVVFLAMLPKNYARPKQDFAGAVAYFNAGRQPGDRLAAIGLAVEPLRSYYAPETYAIDDEKDVSRLRNRAGQLWLVTAFDDHVEATQEPLLASLRRGAIGVREFDGTLGGGEVRVYRLPALRGSTDGG